MGDGDGVMQQMDTLKREKERLCVKRLWSRLDLDPLSL
jgi:hypothetical protein